FAGANQPSAHGKIRFTPLGGNVTEVQWKDGDAPPDALSCVSVFDARTAPLYANEDNKIEYLPQGLDVLPRLGELMKKLQKEIATEITNEETRIGRTVLPVFTPGTIVAEAVEKLVLSSAVHQLPTSDSLSAL